MKKFCLLALTLAIVSSISDNQSIKITQFKVYPHNRSCYTQGLFFLNQTHLFETCGLYKTSHYQVMKYQTDKKSFQFSLAYSSKSTVDKNVFLEGATRFTKTGDIYLLTWRENKVFRVNNQSFAIKQIKRWQKDGWGLTNNQTNMFVSDGSAYIYIVDENFKILGQKLIVDKEGRKISNINELEYVVENRKPYIYANIYMERRIVKIDIEKGKVVKQYDLLKLIQNQKGLKYDEVINGIAYHRQSNKFLLTGKNWANYYWVSLN